METIAWIGIIFAQDVELLFRLRFACLAIRESSLRDTVVWPVDAAVVATLHLLAVLHMGSTKLIFKEAWLSLLALKSKNDRRFG